MTTTTYSAAPSTLDLHLHHQPRLTLRGRWHLAHRSPRTPASTIDIRDARRLPADRLVQQWAIR